MEHFDWWNAIYEDAEIIGCEICGFDCYRRTIDFRLVLDADNVAKAIIANHGKDCKTYGKYHLFPYTYNNGNYKRQMICGTNPTEGGWPVQRLGDGFETNLCTRCLAALARQKKHKKGGRVE